MTPTFSPASPQQIYLLKQELSTAEFWCTVSVANLDLQPLSARLWCLCTSGPSTRSTRWSRRFGPVQISIKALSVSYERTMRQAMTCTSRSSCYYARESEIFTFSERLVSLFSIVVFASLDWAFVCLCEPLTMFLLTALDKPTVQTTAINEQVTKSLGSSNKRSFAKARQILTTEEMDIDNTTDMEEVLPAYLPAYIYKFLLNSL